MTVINKYPSVEGAEVHVTNEGGYFKVSVYDTNEDDYLSTSYIFNSPEKARKLAKEIAEKGEFL